MYLPPFPPQAQKQRDQKTKSQLDKEMTIILDEAARINQTLYSFVKMLKKYIDENSQNAIVVEIKCDIPNPTVSPICSRTVGPTTTNKVIFKCYDCEEASNSIQCRQCFSQADHKGHNYIQTNTADGCCDCGNQQMFNPKGFCPTHSKKVTSVNIPQAIRSQFIKEGVFWFYLIFWLTNRLEQFSFSHIFVKRQTVAIMNQLIRLASQNYDTKVIIYEVLQLSLLKMLPQLPEIPYGKLPILSMVFRVKEHVFLEYFCRLTYELFPIEQMRKYIIFEYFQKCEDDHNFGFDHPMRLINFQFLTCMKAVNSMLRNGQIKPPRLPRPSKIEQSEDPDRLILRIVDDFNYPSQMRGAKQFHKLICQDSNIAETLLCYRFVPDEMICKVVHDEYFIKTLKQLIINISEDKQIMEKLLKQLWLTILQVKIDSLSLIHERAFVMVLTAYLEGNLSKMKQSSCINKLCEVLRFNFKKGADTLIGLASYHLNNSIRPFYQYYQAQIPNDCIWEYFMERNPEKRLAFILDLTYQKILILLSSFSINYNQIAGKIIEQTACSKHPHKYDKLLHLLSMVNTIVSVNTSDIAAQCLLTKENKEEVLNFYGRFVNTFKEWKAIQIKNKAVSVVHKKQLFQQFVKGSCIFQKGFLRTKEPYQALPYATHKFFFEQFNINMIDSHHKILEFKLLPQFQKAYCWTEKTIQILIQACGQVFNNIEEEVNPLYQFKHSPSLFAQELIKMYEVTSSLQLKQFFCGEFKKMLQPINAPFLKSRINHIFNLEQPQELFQKTSQKQQQKKNKLLQKKREKDEKLKQMRKQMLEKHNITDTSLETNDNVCIFCRECTNDELKLISSVSLQNILNKHILKVDCFRLSFRTCGHKIHQKCFFNNLYDIEKVCFLCRRPANLLIPNFSQESPLQQCQQFLDKLYPTLVEYYEEYNDQIAKIFDPAQENSIIRALINSFISQLLLLGAWDEIYNKQHVIPVCQKILFLLKSLPKAKVLNALELDQQKIPNNNEWTQMYDQARVIFAQNVYNQKKNHEKQNKMNQIFSILSGQKPSWNVEKIKLFDPFSTIINLPKGLPDLQRNMGKCPSCSIVIDQILMCLICGWRVCIREKDELLNHIRTHGNCLFIKCDTGNPIYVFKGHFFMRESIYINYLGESYVSNHMKATNTSQFLLNRQKYEIMKQKIVMNEIPSLVLTELT